MLPLFASSRNHSMATHELADDAPTSSYGKPAADFASDLAACHGVIHRCVRLRALLRKQQRSADSHNISPCSHSLSLRRHMCAHCAP